MSMAGLHIVLLIYFYEPDLKTPDDLLERYSTIRPIARALQDAGAEVSVLQRFHQNVSFVERGICFEFCADECPATLREWQIPYSFHRAVREACQRWGSTPTVVHIHGLLYPLQTRCLRSRIPVRCAMVAQHHAEKPWKAVRQPLQKWGLQMVDGFFFAARKLASLWLDRGLLSMSQPIFEVMEGSTFFRWKERGRARARTGLAGEPTLLWVGNLTRNKDPLTVLAGFERILQQVPKARLYMAYRCADLLHAVQDRITSSATLRGSVTLLGSVPHSNLEDIYNSADYFVLGSHYEGSGFSLAEAMACGVVPVVTAIPSFEAMTDGGRAGACWAAGDCDAFRTAFFRVLGQPLDDLSRQVQLVFDQRLSYPAIARASLRAYNELISMRSEARL
jgi:glycosyltransferase involved in cell wall biosynthesis